MPLPEGPPPPEPLPKGAFRTSGAPGRAPLRERVAGVGRSAIILPGALLSAIAVTAVGFGMVFYARDVYRASPAAIGVLAALPHLVYMIGCLGMRPLFGRLLPRHWMLIGSASMALLLALILGTRSLWLLFLLYAAFGWGEALLWPPIMGWLAAGKEDQELNRTITRFNLMWSTGTILGPLWGGILVERSPATALAAGAALSGAVVLLVLTAPLLLPRLRQDRSREPDRQPGEILSRQGTPLRYPAWVGLFAGYVIIGILISVFPLYAREVLGLPERRIGMLLLLRTFASTVGFLLLGRMVFWHHRFWPMLAAQSGIVLVLMLMILLRGFLPLGLLLAALGLLFALGYNSSIFHGTAGTRQRTRRMGVHEAILTAGVVAGSSAGGAVYERASMPGVLGFGAAVVGAALAAQVALFLLLQRRSRSG